MSTLGVGSSSLIGGVLVTITGVSIFPTSVQLVSGNTQQFSAEVTGTGDFDPSVAWSATAGIITSTGFYTPPAATTVAQTVTIRVQSIADGSKFAQATVTIPAVTVVDPPPIVDVVNTVTVSPNNLLLNGGNSIRFHAVVAGTGNINQAVTWEITGGFIDATGLAVMPLAETMEQVITVTATSVQDPTKKGIATVTVQSIIGENPEIIVVPPSRILRTDANDWSIRQNYTTTQGDTFYYSQGYWLIDKDVDDNLYYGLDISPYLGVITANISGVTAISKGVTVTEGPYVRSNMIIVKVSGGDTSLNYDVENSITFRIRCSNGENFDRTIYFILRDH
jgi:hypothetical protein